MIIVTSKHYFFLGTSKHYW